MAETLHQGRKHLEPLIVVDSEHGGGGEMKLHLGQNGGEEEQHLQLLLGGVGDRLGS